MIVAVTSARHLTRKKQKPDKNAWLLLFDASA
jgi:hypothetical protein